MAHLTPAMRSLLERVASPTTVTLEDGSTYTPGRLVSGHEYRTALALERRGLVTIRYQGQGRGWVLPA